MRLAIVSNSHAASLKGGWEIVAPEFPEVKVTFFAALGERMAGLALDQQALVANDAALAGELRVTSGGLDRIDLTGYDAFFVYGLGLDLPVMQRGVSRAVSTLAVSDLLQHCLSMKLSRIIAGHATAPLFVGPAPLRIQPERPQEVAQSRGHDEVFDDVRRALEGERLTLHRQPAETIAGEWHTKRDFTPGMRRVVLNRGANQKIATQIDHVHANAAYGAIYMRHLMQTLGCGDAR